MSRNEPRVVREHSRMRPQQPKPARKPDERARRTRNKLGMAFLELIHERPIEDVTVQDVLDRASVGRSTFYLHFRDKNDLLLSQLERFGEHMSTLLSVQKEKSLRVAPVAEMFAHIEQQKKLYRILADAGRLNDFFDLAQEYFARGIAQRLKESRRLPDLPQPELAARAFALAGTLLSLLRWWLDHGAKEPPHAMDELYHRMVWNGLR
jgi:AcrR family transcriptional regulator